MVASLNPWQLLIVLGLGRKDPRVERRATLRVEAGGTYELAERFNGLIDEWDREGFELDLETGKGGVWLRLTDDQYRAIGGDV